MRHPTMRASGLAPALWRSVVLHRVRAALAGAVVLAAVTSGVLPARFVPPPIVAAAHAESAPRPAQIDRNGVLILIRSTLLALQQANETGNYTVLRDLGAPGFQQANTAVRLGEIFANLRAQKVDLSGVAALDPQLTLLPQIEANGLMHMAGFFPSVPTQIKFELLYAPVDSRWRLFGLSVNLASSSPVAPSPPATVTPQPKPKAEPPRAKRKPHAAKPPETPAPEGGQ